MLSAPVVRWLVASEAFARDTARAAAIANGSLVPRGTHVERIPQDVQMGYWLAAHPTLRYIHIPRKLAWADAFVEVTDLRRLLIAHRVPWDQLAWLTSRTERLWHSGNVTLNLRCAGAPCPPGQCTHPSGQVSCAAELLVTPDVSGPLPAIGCNGCECWEGEGTSRVSSGGTCNFTRAYVPNLPAHCTWHRD